MKKGGEEYRYNPYMASGLEQFASERLGRLKELGLKYNVTVKRVRHDYSFEYRWTNWVEKLRAVDVFGSYDPANFAAVRDFRDAARALFESRDYGAKGQAEKVVFRLNPVLNGLKCPPVHEVVPLIGMKCERKTVAPRPGDVTLLYFWNSSSERAVAHLKQHSAMFESHPEWVGKVRLLELGNDDNFDATMKELVFHHWERIEHYWMSRAAWDGLWQQIPNREGPYYVLVDKDCEIVFGGELEWAQMEANLDHFMSGEPLVEDNGETADDRRVSKFVLRDPSYPIAQYRQDLDNYAQALHSDFERMTYLLLEVDFYQIHSLDKSPELFGSMCLRYNWFAKYKDAHERIRSEALKRFEQRLEVRTLCEEKQLYKVEYGQKCESCKRDLNVADQYRCAICAGDKQPSYCVGCASINDQAKAVAGLVHPHPLYYLQKDSKMVLDELKIEHMQPCKVSKPERKQPLTCKFCGTNPLETLFKCANCVEFDICHSCFRTSKDPTHAKYTEISQLAQNYRHDLNTHVYVREDFVGMVAYYF